MISFQLSASTSLANFVPKLRLLGVNMSFFLSMLLALCFDRLVGWPDPVYRRLSHPVVGIGYIISTLANRLNKPEWPAAVRFSTGLISLSVLICLGAAASLSVVSVLPSGWAGIVLTAVLVLPFLAAKSLTSHVRAVEKPLHAADLATARQALAMIVGRNSATLDTAGISRAAIESLAENTSDGVTAPLFWGVLFGLPGVVIYKAVNTADSMIGHRNETFAAFGWAAARLDDLVNLIPARLTGLIYALLAKHRRKAIQIMVTDAPRHRSPNAGWPEAAVSAALGIRLSGPRQYEGVATTDPWLNETGRDPGAADISLALCLYNRLLWVVSLLLFLGAVLVFRVGNGTGL